MLHTHCTPKTPPPPHFTLCGHTLGPCTHLSLGLKGQLPGSPVVFSISSIVSLHFATPETQKTGTAATTAAAAAQYGVSTAAGFTSNDSCPTNGTRRSTFVKPCSRMSRCQHTRMSRANTMFHQVKQSKVTILPICRLSCMAPHLCMDHLCKNTSTPSTLCTPNLPPLHHQPQPQPQWTSPLLHPQPPPFAPPTPTATPMDLPPFAPPTPTPMEHLCKNTSTPSTDLPPFAPPTRKGRPHSLFISCWFDECC
jgi:hypothetical protein